MENNYRMSELGFWVPVRDSREWVPVEDFAEAENQPRHDKRDARPASSDPPSAGMANNYRMSQSGFWVPVERASSPPVEDFGEAKSLRQDNRREACPVSLATANNFRMSESGFWVPVKQPSSPPTQNFREARSPTCQDKRSTRRASLDADDRAAEARLLKELRWMRRYMTEPDDPSLRPHVQKGFRHIEDYICQDIDAEIRQLEHKAKRRKYREAGAGTQLERFAAVWREEDHPRDDDGRFKNKGGVKQAAPVVKQQLTTDFQHIPADRIERMVADGLASEYLGYVYIADVAADGGIYYMILKRFHQDPKVQTLTGRDGKYYYQVVGYKHLPPAPGIDMATRLAGARSEERVRETIDTYLHGLDTGMAQFGAGAATFVLHAIPLGAAADLALHRQYGEAAISLAGDAALLFSGGLSKVATTARGVRNFRIAGAAIQGGIAATRATQGILAARDGDTDKAAGYFGEATLRLLGMSAATIDVLKKAPLVKLTARDVKPGAIGLGFDEHLGSLRRLGATTYEKWFDKGLTKVRPYEANLSEFKFYTAFSDAADKCPQIVFDLSELDIARALKNGTKGFTYKNYTNAELHYILNKPQWLKKTTFIDKGNVVKPIIRNGKVTGFAP